MRYIRNKGCKCAALVAFFLFFTTFGIAEATTYYKVRQGDSLARISKKFHVPVDSLKEANDLDSNNLSVGKKLKIPGKASAKADKTKKLSKANKAVKTDRSEKSEAATSVEKSAGENVSAKASLENKYHTVRKRETLAKIAHRYGLSVAELKELNNIQGNRLKVGRKLIVGRSQAAPDQAADSTAQNRQVVASASEKIAEVKALSQSDELSNLSVKERLILFSKKMINLPYKFGGNSAVGVDCSAFVQRAYSLIGHSLPRSAREQYTVGQAVDKDELQTGDLLFFRTYASFPSHVGIYLGNNLFIHASSKSKRVQIDNLGMPYYVKRFIGAKRLISETETTAAPELQTHESVMP
ncbi:MAG TPA: NlpC/P60 family protein [Dissulfurispiraceae bacterium]|nr:NlpC/P60 family protein [Dissulfurispiraceae bacterium]